MRAISAILLGAVITFLTGCKSKPKSPPSVQPKAGEQVVETKPEAKSETGVPSEVKVTYRYEPFGKPDPFEPIFSERKSAAPSLVKSPLEEYNVSQFELIGIIWGTKEPAAIVKDPKGETYIIKKGTRIGRNNGRVTRIEERKVYVVEEYEDIYGHITTGEVVLELTGEE